MSQDSGIVYYVSPCGSDAHDGTAPERAWRTLERVSRAAFGPASRILFEGGYTFEGTLRFDEADIGTAQRPIIVGSYGHGRAVIDGKDGYGLLVRNTGGFHIENLNVRGAGPALNRGSGIAIENDRPGDIKMEHLRIDSVDVHGFGYHGLVIDGKNGKSGFRDVRISRVNAHNNALSGITVQGRWQENAAGYAHEDVYIGRSSAHENPGAPGRDLYHSGSGIVISDVDQGVIEHSVAYGNGWLCESVEGGPFGIWAWDSNALLIQFNISCRNRTAGQYDGGGFDLDGGVSNSLVRYNLSFDNDGAGFLLMQFPFGRPQVNNQLKSNISYQDGRKNSFGGITIMGEVTGAIVERNTICITPAAEAEPAAFAVVSNRPAPMTGKAVDCRVRWNLFQSTRGAPLIRVDGDHRRLLFEENAYLVEDSPFRIDWQGGTCKDLSEWRVLSQQDIDTPRQGARDANLTDFSDPCFQQVWVLISG